MNYEDFIRPSQPQPVEEQKEEQVTIDQPSDESAELDVQKAVVESLAADKVEQNEKIVKLQDEINSLKSKISDLNDQLLVKTGELQKLGDVLAKTSETENQTNIVALLDRNVDLSDKFEGETRDHVLEAIKAAFDAAESSGRIRCAKILESVLIANIPSGNLEQKRVALEKIFKDNCNIVSGPVIDELNKAGIPFKNGEEYLLPSEIIKRNY